MSSTQIVKINDRDATYSSGWQQQGTGTEYTDTVILAASVGTTASISFTGTSIVVYGIPSTSWEAFPTSSFSVDGGPMAQSDGSGTQRRQNQRRRATSSQYKQQIYASPDLSPGDHVLLITITSVPDANSSYESNYVEYYLASDSGADDPSSSPVSGVATQTATPSISSGPSNISTFHSSTSSKAVTTPASASDANVHTSIYVTVLVASSDGTGSSTSTSSASSVTDASDASSNHPQATRASSKSSTPVILGAVVGVLVLLLICIGIFFLVKRHKSLRGANPIDGEHNGLSPHNTLCTRLGRAPTVNIAVTPFVPNQVNASPAAEHSPTSPWGPSQELFPFDPYLTTSAAASSSVDVFSPPSFGYSKAAEVRQPELQVECECDYPPPCYES